MAMVVFLGLQSRGIYAAKEKAKLMASTLGQKVGQPISIQESRRHYGYKTKSFEWGFMWSGGMSQNITSMERELSEVERLVAPSSVSVTATVEISFQLE